MSSFPPARPCTGTPAHTCINTATTVDAQPPPPCPACLLEPLASSLRAAGVPADCTEMHMAAHGQGQENGARDMLDQLEAWMAQAKSREGFYLCTPLRVFEVLESWIAERRAALVAGGDPRGGR